jgi:hypothetical protein
LYRKQSNEPICPVDVIEYYSTAGAADEKDGYISQKLRQLHASSPE